MLCLMTKRERRIGVHWRGLLVNTMYLVESVSKKVLVGHNNDYFSAYCARDVMLMNIEPSSVSKLQILTEKHSFSPGRFIRNPII